MSKTIALVSPGRTSSGGSAFSSQLAHELKSVLGAPVPEASVPPSGRVTLPSTITSCDVVVNLGARVMPHDGLSIYWPLNVAPLDNGLDILPHTSPRNRARHVLLRTRLRQSVNRADALVFGSHYARTLYMARYARGSQLPYRVIPGGSPSLDVVPNAPDHESPPFVLVCSHLYPYKGILEFIDAFIDARAHLPSGTTVRIAGADRDNVYAQAVHRRIADAGLSEDVTVAPAGGDELKALYAAADLCVFPSLCENAGSFSLFDGLHAGAATLSSDRSSMPEVVRGATAMVNPFDRRAFARILAELCGDPGRLRALRSQALGWSTEAPTWRWRAEQLVDFVEEVTR